jgi:hypothetical protein
MNDNNKIGLQQYLILKDDIQHDNNIFILKTHRFKINNVINLSAPLNFLIQGEYNKKKLLMKKKEKKAPINAHTYEMLLCKVHHPSYCTTSTNWRLHRTSDDSSSEDRRR